MTFEAKFVEIELGSLRREAAVMKAESWRFIQTHAVYTDDGVDLYYSFMKDGAIRNLKVKGVQPGTPVPSITDLFLAAFVFENEARELFGVNMQGIAIDFDGGLYAPAESEPMTIISPEQKAAREKARKAAAAKAAKNTGMAGEPSSEAPARPGGFVMTDEKRAKLEAKLATMPPDKVAKVRAALAEREAGSSNAAASKPDASAKAESAPAQSSAPAEEPTYAAPVDAQLEAKLALLDSDKADKVRAALGLKGTATEMSERPDNVPGSLGINDAELAGKLAMMDPEKAEKVRAALSAKAVRSASEGGE